jgi:LPXTG-site transpeptidase (sortase) family protein
MPARLALDPRRQARFRFLPRVDGALLFGGVAITGFVLFFLWLVVTFTPVLRVELQYQWRRFSRELLGGGSIMNLFVPNVSFDLRGGLADNTENGIVIPKVYVDAPVVFNVDPNDSAAYTVALRQGIAHASGTSFPDEGGLGYYFAHSSAPELRSQFNAVFYLLGKLEPGDEIFLWHDGERYEYKVRELRTVPPTDVSFLQEQTPTETIVLQTCWPPGTSLNRRLVFADRVQ